MPPVKEVREIFTSEKPQVNFANFSPLLPSLTPPGSSSEFQDQIPAGFQPGKMSGPR